MTRLLAPTVAVLFACALAAPVAAEEPPGLAERVERIGKLPAELVKAKKSNGDIVEALFLAAYSRLPTEKELETGVKHLAAAANTDKARAAAARDLAWAVVNTKEFLKLSGFDNDLATALKFLNNLTDKWEKDAKEKN
jgi:hypothetical protein